ncbi:MAG: DUF1801 domain-containing protein [Cyclobacteriaceae bacterium]
MNGHKPKTIDEYISDFPEHVREIMERVRFTIAKAAPQAEEVISYSMPAFKLNGVLVYFAGWQNHLGFYPFSSAIRAFQKDLSKYEGAKGSIKFPYDKPIPYTLISKMVKYRVKENLEKAKLKALKKKKKSS